MRQVYKFVTIICVVAVFALLYYQRSGQSSTPPLVLAPGTPTSEGIHIGVSDFDDPHLLELAVPASDLIAIAQVVKQHPAQWSTLDGAKPVGWQPNAASYDAALIYTAYSLQIKKVLRGDEAAPVVQVAVLGGVVGEDRVDVSSGSGFPADMIVGDKVLIFLRKSQDGVAYVAPYSLVDGFRVEGNRLLAGCHGERQRGEGCRVKRDLEETIQGIERWDAAPLTLPPAPIEIPPSPK